MLKNCSMKISKRMFNLQNLRQTIFGQWTYPKKRVLSFPCLLKKIALLAAADESTTAVTTRQGSCLHILFQILMVQLFKPKTLGGKIKAKEFCKNLIKQSLFHRGHFNTRALMTTDLSITPTNVLMEQQNVRLLLSFTEEIKCIADQA